MEKQFNPDTIVRENVRRMHAYSCAQRERESAEGILLDANENPYGILNRYPDPRQCKLKNLIGKQKSINTESIFIGNGSDEIIDLVLRVFCKPQQDKALTFHPTYGMYEVLTSLNDVELLKISLDKDFDIPASTPSLFESPYLKVVFVCSPNNPSGNAFSEGRILQVIKHFNGIVLIDEAYVDFTSVSFSQFIDQYPNLIVTQTMSKAWGLASARIGMAFANKKIIAWLNKIKPPYNVSLLNQEAAINALQNKDMFESNKRLILSEKERLKAELEKLPIVQHLYPTDANFFLVKVTDVNSVYDYLVQKKIIVRNRSHIVKDCIRITVGTLEENNLLTKALQQINP